MKNYTILAEYKRQYIEKYKDNDEPVISESSWSEDSLEMDIELPYGDKFLPFKVIYNNTETIKLYYMEENDYYVDVTYYKESQKVREVNLYNLLSAASNLVSRHTAAKKFEECFRKLTKEEFSQIEVEYYDDMVAKRYCGTDYSKEAIKDVYRLLSFCNHYYIGKPAWKVEVGSYGAKHVFETLLSSLSDTSYVHTNEFAAAAAMFYMYKCQFETLNLKKDGPNWTMELPDYYEVLSEIRGK